MKDEKDRLGDDKIVRIQQRKIQPDRLRYKWKVRPNIKMELRTVELGNANCVEVVGCRTQREFLEHIRIP
jgi:hypothetical protein